MQKIRTLGLIIKKVRDLFTLTHKYWKIIQCGYDISLPDQGLSGLSGLLLLLVVNLVPLRVGSKQNFCCSCCDFPLQPANQRCDQSLLGVVGGEDQQHGVPGQTGQSGDTAGLSGEERVTEDHSLLDTPEGPQQLEDLRHVPLPGRKKIV